MYHIPAKSQRNANFEYLHEVHSGILPIPSLKHVVAHFIYETRVFRLDSQKREYFFRRESKCTNQAAEGFLQKRRAIANRTVQINFERLTSFQCRLQEFLSESFPTRITKRFPASRGETRKVSSDANCFHLVSPLAILTAEIEVFPHLRTPVLLRITNILTAA